MSQVKPGFWRATRSAVHPAYRSLWDGMMFGLPMLEAGSRILYDPGSYRSITQTNVIDVPTGNNWVVDDHGPALEFNGNRIFIQSQGPNPTVPDFDPPPQGTVTMLLNPGTTTDERIYGFADAYEITLGYDAGNIRYSNQLWAAGGVVLNGPYLTGTNHWTLVTCTYDSATGAMTLWYDGELVASGSDADDDPGTNGSVSLGGRQANFYTGRMGCFYQWDRVLTDGEIQRLAQDPWGHFRPAVYPHYPAGLLPSTSLYATGTQSLDRVVNELDTTTNLHQSVDDDPDTPTDSDWINNEGAV